MNSLINKILNSNFVSKSVVITILILVLTCLNLLGIDIKYISDSTYGLIILIFVNIFITILLYPISTFRIASLDNYLKTSENLLILTEEIKDDYDFIKSKIIILDKNFDCVNSIIHNIYEELKGIPNIKILKLILELRTKGLWNDIFKECLTYILTTNKDNYDITINTTKININDIVFKYLIFIKENIYNYDVDENLTKDIEIKINVEIENVCTELRKETPPVSKLYIISLILKSTQDDINKITVEYLRKIQANIIQ